mmetsp:Transcript_14780/g.21916  ORF Transcript_14780/g.21916 Transcript_14780/m.21916 type:complete len:97 (+) Transcript_14780:181-471(+)
MRKLTRGILGVAVSSASLGLTSLRFNERKEVPSLVADWMDSGRSCKSVGIDSVGWISVDSDSAEGGSKVSMLFRAGGGGGVVDEVPLATSSGGGEV